MNCKLHTIFTHLSTTQTKSLIDVFFSSTKVTGSDRWALLSQEWSWTVSYMWQSYVEIEHYSIALFQPHYRVLNAAAQNFDQGQSSYVLHQLIRHSCTYAAHMSPALKGSYVLQRFERGNAVKICNDIMFDIYTELTHKIFIHLSTTQWLNYWLMFVFFHKVTGSDRRALLSQEWSWTVSYIRYSYTFQLRTLMNTWHSHTACMSLTLNSSFVLQRFDHVMWLKHTTE